MAYILHRPPQVAIGSSVGLVFVVSAINYALQRWVLPRKPALIGFTAPATHPHLVKEEELSLEGKGSSTL